MTMPLKLPVRVDCSTIIDADGEFVADPLDYLTAVEIALAVNSHAELIRAAKIGLAWIEGDVESPGHTVPDGDEIRRILAKVEG